ncbi:hypothetical protein AA0118_g12780 [Alternaria tenuissima]|uniref:Uncharacterized protein n=1 Tax=Alternaria tenuissima TaxID=119927 RepID=A0A4Q4LZ70_9PLEO|nr:hypothetical protein AA0114_g12428 [Alternaria tenuissima]RYN45664.1 hypothetical protein AA0118_g12780 [Alternaria tenuissima]
MDSDCELVTTATYPGFRASPAYTQLYGEGWAGYVADTLSADPTSRFFASLFNGSFGAGGVLAPTEGLTLGDRFGDTSDDDVEYEIGERGSQDNIRNTTSSPPECLQFCRTKVLV